MASSKCILPFVFVLFFPFVIYSQETLETDSLYLPSADSIRTPALISDTTIGDGDFDSFEAPVLAIDTTKKINYWRITRPIGEIVPACPDTFLTDYFNRTNAEGQSVFAAYLGNLGLPMESRVFFERADRSQFMFNDPFYAYIKSPETFNFINTKVPHSNVAYQRAGSRIVMEERFQALLTTNFGRKLNVGVDMDYLYARGYYQSQSAKHLEWVFFGNYLSDRHRVHLFINPGNRTNAENGGIVNPSDITHPIGMGANFTTRDIQTRLGFGGRNSVWNRIQGNQVYLNYRYNLGFERKTGFTDEEGDTIKQFIPVSSIIYTFDYRDNEKKFYTTDSTSVAKYYADNFAKLPSHIKDYFNDVRGVRDSTSWRSMSHTFALSMREGFSKWVKFDLTAFLTYDIRSFAMMTTNDAMMQDTTRHAMYIGGELAKRTGKFFRYHAQGSVGLLGENLGDLNLSGTIETRIPFLGDIASIQANVCFKNLTPTWYEKHYRSRYFWWDKEFDKVKKLHIGGTIDIPHTQTRLNVGVENVSNYIYFNKDGEPDQETDNIQVIAVRLDQNFKWKALHWDNQIVYQKSSKPNIIPLPDLAAYSSLYIQFLWGAMTMQLGVNCHYWTKYYAPTYEPATQQFKLQDMQKTENYSPVEVGNYPLMSAFVNCHLKQTRFFIQYYNMGAMFISPPNYFSLPYYPVNPTIIKLGLSVDFIN